MEKWVIYAIISMVFAGLTSVVAKFGMTNLSSDIALAIRTMVVLCIVLANAFLFRNTIVELKQAFLSNYIFLAISGVTTSVSWIFYYRAMKLGPVSYVASIDKASIVVTLLFSFILLKEPLTAKVLAGASFILIDMLILVWK
jgi:transporter family protein